MKIEIKLFQYQKSVKKSKFSQKVNFVYRIKFHYLFALHNLPNVVRVYSVIIKKTLIFLLRNN